MKGDKRRNIKTAPRLRTGNILELCNKAKSPRDACLVALLYLSGRRICEVLGLRRNDFTQMESRVFFKTFNEKVWRAEKTQGYGTGRTIIRMRKVKPDQKPVQVLRRIQRNGHDFEVYQDTIWNQDIMPNWSLKSPGGRLLSPFVLPFLESLKPNGFLFEKKRGEGAIGYSMAYRIIRTLAPAIWPHVLRHERFTEIVAAFRENPVQAHKLTFHKRFESTIEYVRELAAEEVSDRI